VRHALWVKSTHWLVTASFLILAFSGFIILMAHPRLYWGETGNNLTPALIELPISRNHQHAGWEKDVPFFSDANSPVSASRTYNIFNQNGWGRSLHFLAAWCLVAPGIVYFLAGLFGGHFWRRLCPKDDDFALGGFWRDVKNHLRLRVPPATGGPDYGLLQKCTYCAVVFLALPLAIITGLAMAPAISAAYPFLSAMWGGSQSARTIHFFVSVVLVLFLLVHVGMVARSGFKRQMRAMTLGK